MCPTLQEFLYRYDTWFMSLCVDDLVCKPGGHLHLLTYTRCRIDTISSPDDGYIAVRNMYRTEINIHEK